MKCDKTSFHVCYANDIKRNSPKKTSQKTRDFWMFPQVSHSKFKIAPNLSI